MQVSNINVHMISNRSLGMGPDKRIDFVLFSSIKGKPNENLVESDMTISWGSEDKPACSVLNLKILYKTMVDQKELQELQ